MGPQAPSSAPVRVWQQPHVRDALVIGLAVSVFGAAFGVLAGSQGLSIGQTMAMSLLVFTGASQFASVGVIAAGGTQAAAIGSALLLAARNSFYGMSMAQHLTMRWPFRALAAQLVIDESTALAMAQEDEDKRGPAFLACGLSVFVFWNLGTLAGAVGGEAIGDPEALGLDAAFPAGFISLAAPALRRRAGLVAAVVGGLVVVVATAFVEPGVPVLLASVGAVVALGVEDGPIRRPRSGRDGSGGDASGRDGNGRDGNGRDRSGR